MSIPIRSRYSWLLAPILAAGLLFSPGAAQAQSLSPAPTESSAKLDAEAQRLITLLATSVLAHFAAQAGKGSLDGFDPGSALQSALRSTLDSRQLQSLIDRVVDQAGSAPDGPGALSPELRALIKVALSGAVAIARNELARSLEADRK